MLWGGGVQSEPATISSIVSGYWLDLFGRGFFSSKSSCQPRIVEHGDPLLPTASLGFDVFLTDWLESEGRDAQSMIRPTSFATGPVSFPVIRNGRYSDSLPDVCDGLLCMTSIVRLRHTHSLLRLKATTNLAGNQSRGRDSSRFEPAQFHRHARTWRLIWPK